jgi:hypothetical protein
VPFSRGKGRLFGGRVSVSVSVSKKKRDETNVQDQLASAYKQQTLWMVCNLCTPCSLLVLRDISLVAPGQDKPVR